MKKLWKKRGIFCGILCFLLVMLVCIGCENEKKPAGDNEKGKNENENRNVQTVLSDEPESVPAHEEDGVYALFAVNSSRAGRLSGSKIQRLEDGKVTTKVSATAKLGYKFVRWSDGVTDATREGESFSSTTVLTAIFDYDFYDLPVIFINTDSGKDVESKTEYAGMHFSIANTEETYRLDDLSALIRGRGNNTWTYDKKSYKLKFDKKISLLGVGKKAKTWVLLANMCDQSLLRNQTALNLIQCFDGIAYEPHATSVEVYLNGEYRGVYLLAEEITVSSAHVDLDDSGVETETDTAYLLEMSYYAEDVAFVVHGKNFEIKNDLSSDPDVAAKQKAFIGSYVQSAWDALKTGDREKIEKVIDLDSLVDAYIAEEIVKNLDMGWDSFYLNKDAGGKLRFGPLWDFDLSFGNGNETCQYITELYCGIEYAVAPALSNPWFYRAMQWGWFRELVTARFDELYEKFCTMPEEVLATGAKYQASFERNFDKWKIFGQCMNRETEYITSLKTYEEHYRYLASWIADRIAWLQAFYHSADYFSGEYKYTSVNGEQSREAVKLASSLSSLQSLTKNVKKSSITSDAEAMSGEDATKLFDGDTKTKLCCNVHEKTTVKFTLNAAATVVGYTISTGGDTSAFPERNPREWALYGSADGKVWNLLDRVTNGYELLEAADEKTYGFPIDHPGEYSYYRIVFDHEELMQISEVVLYQ